MEFSDLHLLPILVAALASFAVGFVWYGPLFGSKWQKEMQLSDAEIKNANMRMIFGTAFLLSVILAATLDMVLPVGVGDTLNGLGTGLLLGLGLVATSFGTNYLFGRKSLSLFFIDAGYHVVVITLMATIIAAWV